jgi:hypothetical protein
MEGRMLAFPLTEQQPASRRPDSRQVMSSIV